MNILKWAKQSVAASNKKKGGGIEKGAAIRKRVVENLPKYEKSGGVMGAIARKRMREKKILDQMGN